MEKYITPRPWKRPTHAARVTLAVKVGSWQREQQDLRQGSWVEVPILRLDWFRPNPEEGVLASFVGVLPEGFIAGRPWEAECSQTEGRVQLLTATH